MATTIKIRGDSNSDEPVVLVGRALRPLTKITSLIRSRVIREVVLPIGGVSEEPEIVFSAELVAPSQLQQSQSVLLSANLFSQVEGGPLALVEDYDSAHWDKDITSGGGSASLGGVNGDLLTATTTLGEVVVTFTYNVPGSEAEGTIATASVEVVASPTFNVVLTNLPASVIQGQSYTLGATRRDGVTGEIVDSNPANFAFTITSGGTFASITNGNQFNINPGTSGNSVTVRATHNAGGEFGSGTTNIIVQPTFPNNEPAGFTTLIAMNGSSLSHAGLTQLGPWTDPSRVSVVVDPASKFGNAIEKRFFIGDDGAWHGLLRGNIGAWNELYMRFVFMMSSNYQYWNGVSGKLIYYDAAGSNLDFILGNENLYWIDGGSGQGQYNAQCYPQLRISRGVYHTLEIHHTASLTPNTGSLRFWFDGVECNNFLRLGQGEFTDLKNRTWSVTAGETDKRIGRVVEFPWFWGGSGFEKSVDDFVRLSEMYISGRN